MVGRRVRSACGVATLIVLVGGGEGVSVGRGAPPASPLEQALDQKLKSLTAPEGGASPAAPTPEPEELPAAMQAAGDQLVQGKLAEGIAEQQRVLQGLDELLQQLSSARQQSPADGAQSSEVAGVGEASPSEAGTPQAGAGGAGPAMESNPQRTGAETVLTPVQRRRDLATAVWGHLPDRVREQLQQSYRERYLPGYEDLVEQYYEALAEEQARSARQR